MEFIRTLYSLHRVLATRSRGVLSVQCAFWSSKHDKMKKIVQPSWVTLWRYVMFMNEGLVVTWSQRNVWWRHRLSDDRGTNETFLAQHAFCLQIILLQVFNVCSLKTRFVHSLDVGHCKAVQHHVNNSFWRQCSDEFRIVVMMRGICDSIVTNMTTWYWCCHCDVTMEKEGLFQWLDSCKSHLLPLKACHFDLL